MKRFIGSALALATLLAATAAAPNDVHRPGEKRKPKDEVPTRDIAIVINGETLAAQPAPRVVGSRLLVPVVRIFSALGIDVARSGPDLVATAPTKKIVLRIGSASANVDGSPVDMGGPASELDGATYVPLRFVSESLGAQVSYEPKSARVEIVSPLVGRVTGFGQTANRGGVMLTGNVTAVDLSSSPPTVTLTRGPSIRTIAISSGARVVVQDTVSRTSVPGVLNDLRAGESMSVTLRQNGTVGDIVVFYASRTGTIAAVTPSAIVTNDGHVILPERDTEVTLNDAPASFSDFKVGDTVSVRTNPETGEKLQIIASRELPQTSTAASNVKIDTFTISAKRALKAGDTFDLELHGTPGGHATYDIGLYLSNLPMRETSAGVYAARYTVPAGVNFANAPVYGHLTVASTSAPRLEAQALLSVSTTPPQITDVVPRDGLVVNNDRPSIFATFDSPSDVGINPSSVRIRVNDRDVTDAATRGPSYVTYSPSASLGGPVDVTVRVTDNAGNTSTRHWTFDVRMH